MNSYLNEDVNYLYEKDHFKQTALHWAAKRGYKDVVEKILSKGKSTNLFDNNNRTPMYLAVMNGHHHILEVISYCLNLLYIRYYLKILILNQ